MKKIKLSFKIMSALFIFAAIGITGCTKNQLGLTGSESSYPENLDNNGGNIIVQQNVTKEEMLKQLKESGKILSVTENYAIPETYLTGILYKYSNGKGEEKQFVVVDKEPKQSDFKGILPHRASVTDYVWTDVNGDIIDEEYVCDGPGGGCLGYKTWFIVY